LYSGAFETSTESESRLRDPGELKVFTVFEGADVRGERMGSKSDEERKWNQEGPTREIKSPLACDA
jgi:hypothetical protein